MIGRFITFEGGEGAGKSTQIKMLAQFLTERGQPCYVTREPGGTPEAEAIRDMIVQSGPEALTHMTEALLHNAARAEHVAKVLLPYLKKGYWVLCDRFIDSTMAYQGYGHGLDRNFLSELNKQASRDLLPNLTFIFDLPVEQGLSRVTVKQSYEKLHRDFHERVRQGFLSIAQNASDRCHLLDASQPLETIHQQIIRCISDRFGLSIS